MRWAGHVARMGEERGVYRVLVGKPEGETPVGRPRHRWVDNIRMDLQEVGCGYTRSVRKVSDRIFLCEHLMDYNLARLHEPTLNLSAHA